MIIIITTTTTAAAAAATTTTTTITIIIIKTLFQEATALTCQSSTRASNKREHTHTI